MSDFTRFVTNKLSGEWSAGNVSGVLTDVIIEYLVTGEKWEGLDPLVRSRLLLAPLFMRKRDLAELQPALAKLAEAGAADKDEWVRAMAQSVDGFDGRLHNDRLLAGSKLVGRTVEGMQALLDAADTRLFRPLEEVYMNKELLQKLRGGSAAPTTGAVQQQQQPAGGGVAPARQHHHFRLRPAAEAPSQRRPAAEAPSQRQASSGSAAPLSRPQHQGQPLLQAVTASRAVLPQRPSAAPAAPSGASRPSPLVATDIDSMFLPRKPSLPRGSSVSLGMARVGSGICAPQPKRAAATLDVEVVKSLNQQMRAEREKAAAVAREAAEAEARARAEARAAERAVKEAEKEAELKRQAEKRAAEKAAREAASKNAREAAKAAKDEEKAAAAAARAAMATTEAVRQEGAAAKEVKRAVKAATKAAGQAVKEPRKRPAPEAGKAGEPPAKHPSIGNSGGGGGAAAVAARSSEGAAAAVVVARATTGISTARAPTLMSPEATAAVLGDAALAAAAHSAGMQLGGLGGMRSIEQMQSFLSAAYGQRYTSSDEEEPV